MPRLYATELLYWQDKTIYEHFFFGSSDWCAAEYDPGDRLFFGYAILNDDFQNSEWGYYGLDEFKAINVRGFEIDRDLFWKAQARWRHRADRARNEAEERVAESPTARSTGSEN